MKRRPPPIAARARTRSALANSGRHLRLLAVTGPSAVLSSSLLMLTAGRADLHLLSLSC
jgi:hypothetical protein